MFLNHVTLGELGRRLDPPVSKQAVSAFIRSVWPLMSTVQRYADAMGVKSEDIMKGSDAARRTER
jgi:hypothetical protein